LPVAEATRLTGRCRTFPGGEHPGHACLGQRRQTLKRPAAGRPGTGGRRKAGEAGRAPAAAV